LAKCAHRNDLILKKTEAILTEPFFKESKRRRFLRGKIQDDGNGNHIALMNKQSSGVLSSILNYNCLIDIPANTPNLIAGQTVDLFML
jgi:molybdopterin molybdotransferase